MDKFITEVKRLQVISEDEALTLAQRIQAITELYFLFEKDVHARTTCVRMIQNLVTMGKLK
jgi:hypothetical protein